MMTSTDTDKVREVMISKTLTITKKQAIALENASDMLKKTGLATTQSDLVRLCIDKSLNDVRDRLFAFTGIDQSKETQE